MSTNKERILRDIDYISGGITAFKAFCNKENKSQVRTYEMLDEWQDILCSVIDMIEEDYESCQKPLKNWQ